MGAVLERRLGDVRGGDGWIDFSGWMGVRKGEWGEWEFE